jgi:hypothetical protein
MTTEKWEINRMTYNLVQKLVKTTGSVADMLANCKIILTLSGGCVMKWLIYTEKRKVLVQNSWNCSHYIPQDFLQMLDGGICI